MTISKRKNITEAPATAASTRPAFIKKSGEVSASVFGHERKTKEGETFTSYSVVFSRSYTDRDGEAAYTQSMEPRHLPHVAMLAHRLAAAFDNLLQD